MKPRAVVPSPWLLACALILATTSIAQLPSAPDPTKSSLLPNEASQMAGDPGTTVHPQAAMEALMQRSQARLNAGHLDTALAGALDTLHFAEEHFGKESIEVARRRLDVALIHRQMGHGAEAMDWAEKAVGLEQKIGDTKSTAYANAVQQLGEIYHAMAEHEAAYRAFSQCRQIFATNLPETAPVVATSAYNLAVTSYQSSKPDAKEQLSAALALQEKQEKPNTTLIGTLSTMLASIRFRDRDYADAEALFRRALAAYRKDEARNATSINSTLLDLMTVLKSTGNLSAADACLRENEEMTRRIFGEQHELFLSLRQHRASMLALRQEFPQAEEAWVRFVEETVRLHGQNTANAVNAELRLGEFYEEIFDYERAEERFLHVLHVVEAASGLDSATAVEMHSKLGDFYFNKTCDFARAGSSYRRAKNILTQTNQLQPRLNYQLAKLEMQQGRKAEAAQLIEEALKQCTGENVIGFANTGRVLLAQLRGDGACLKPNLQHAEDVSARVASLPKVTLGDLTAVATSYQELIVGCLAGKRPTEAEKWSRRILELCDGKISPSHQSLYDATATLIWALHDQQRDKEAKPFVLRQLDAESKNIACMQAGALPRSQLLHLYTQILGTLPISLGLARETAARLLETKGLAQELQLADSREAQAAASVEGRALWEAAAAARMQYRQAVLGGEPSAPIEALAQSCAERNTKLAAYVGLAPEVRLPQRPAVEQVQAALPPDAAFLDWFALPVRERGGLWVSRYGVVVLRPGREPRLLVSRFTMRQVDEMAGYFRASMMKVEGSVEKRNVALDSLHRAFYEMVMETTESELDGVKQLYICPAAALRFVPFAALLDKNGRFLCERFDVRMVASGRELLHKQRPGAYVPDRTVAIFGAPSTKLAGLPAGRRATGPESNRVADFLAARAEPLLKPLPLAEQEAKDVAQHAADAGWKASQFSGDQATELHLRQMPAPRCLHVAAQGYFLDNKLEQTAAKFAASRPVSSRAAESYGVYLPSGQRMGLFLAGAENTLAAWREGKMPAESSDGVLDAQAVSSLRLGGTQLVVLSGCDAGAGTGFTVHQALGLRDAFLAAGVLNVVATLWAAPEADTSGFLGTFFDKYFRDSKPRAAFHEAQRECLVRVRREQGLWQAVRQAGVFVIECHGMEQ
ncbi:MAG: CHAT domain-containing protein [Roseimicrobium sp.]